MKARQQYDITITMSMGFSGPNWACCFMACKGWLTRSEFTSMVRVVIKMATNVMLKILLPIH